MNEVIRFRQILHEAVRSDINVKDLSKHPKHVEEFLFLGKSLPRSDVLSLVPIVTGTYTCRRQEGKEETVECLYQGNGQHFDIEVGNGGDKVTVTLSVTFNH